MKHTQSRRTFDWESAGRELGETLHGYYALVVIGVDPTVTGLVAIGIARGQAFKRRVAVGDLFAESPPIQALVSTDDPHGLVDSFLYGVSLSRIAYEVPNSGQLFVMPSGSEPPDYDEILPSPRWHRLTAGFREVGALLVLAVPAGAPHIEDLVAVADGAVLVGDAVPRQVPVAKIIASVREPAAGPLDKSDGKPPSESAATSPPKNSAKAASKPNRRRIVRMAAIAGVVITIGLAGAGAWLAYRPMAGGGHASTGGKPDTTQGLATVIAPDTATRDSGGDSAAFAATMTMPVVKNPADSTDGAPFAVELMPANTQAGAILKLQQEGRTLPSATFAPVLIQGARWFKVLGGAYASRAGADSLLLGLRRRHVLGDSSGSVVRLPFAFLIDSGVPAAAVTGMVANYADRGQPVYALRQTNGTAWLLAGAFESLEQSSLYAESLRASGIVPVLVYRKGRMF
ncbi:MAG: hypothetical protein ABI205_07355 [Gemmatimonadaceae bacterium]